MSRHQVTFVIPVFNEVRILAASVARIQAACVSWSRWDCDFVIADNGSVDGTWPLAQALARGQPGWKAIRCPRRGRGAALREAWTECPSDVVGYFDVDLSTDLRHVPEMLELIFDGGCQLVLGSRFAPGAVVSRGPLREFLSRAYNLLARWMTASRLRDHQCGFKALTRDAVRALLPGVRNDRWFFDTELLVLAQRRGLRIRELPVIWIDDPDSRVRILPTICEDLHGLWRLRRALRGRGRAGTSEVRSCG